MVGGDINIELVGGMIDGNYVNNNVLLVVLDK